MAGLLSKGTNKHGLDSNLVDVVDTLLARTDIGVITKLKDATKIFMANNLARKGIKYKATQMLVHHKNRGKLGLNPYNAHRVGASVKRIGCDLNQLINAACMQMSPFSDVREEQISFNQKQIDRADGLLANINGTEVSLTLACGHMAAFIRAAESGCRTSEPTLADRNGHINKESIIKNDNGFESLFNVGWEWTEYDWRVDAAWPQFADIAQRAFNASNTVPSTSSEMEVLASIGEFASLEGKHSREDYERYEEAATAGNPACTSYAKLLSSFDELYGGGVGSPIVHELDIFQKGYAENLILGEEFLSGVVEGKLHDTKLMGRSRQAAIAANLTAPKKVNGVAKLLSRSDFLGLRRHKETPIMDERFQKAADVLQTITDEKKITELQRIDLYHRFLVRYICFMCGKGSLTFEKKDYKTSIAIIELLADEVVEDVKLKAFTKAVFIKLMGVTVPDPAKQDDKTPGGAPAKPPQPEADDKQSTAPIGLSDLEDPVFIAKRSGFEKDKMIYEKSTGRDTIYKIIDIGTKIEIKEQSNDKTIDCSLKIELAALLTKFVPFKGDMQLIMDASMVDKYGVEGNADIALDMAKAQLFNTMCTYAMDTASPSYKGKLQFRVKPMEVRVTCAFKKHELIFVPNPLQMHQISTKASTSVIKTTYAVTMPNGDKVELMVPRLSQPNSVDPKVVERFKVINPYFWVGSTNDKETGNCEEAIVTMVSGIRFSIIRNSKAIKKNEVLKLYTEPKRASPLQDLEVERVIAGSDAAQSSNAPAPKKRRTTGA